MTDNDRVRRAFSIAFLGCVLPATPLLAEEPPTRSGRFVDESLAEAESNTAVTPAPLAWDHWQRRRARLREDLGTTRPGVLFLGDSITEQWGTVGVEAWRDHFDGTRRGGRDAVNLGIAGGRTQSLLLRLIEDDYGRLSPRVVVVLIGTNNLKERRNTPDETAAGVDAVVSRVKVLWPEAEVLLLGVLPCGAAPTSPQRLAAAAANERLADRPAEAGVTFFDATDALCEPDGELTTAISPDGLHLSAEGYGRLAAAIAPIVERLEQRVATAGRRSAL